ncbi:hypothetical protein AMECASPLE_030375 [Ameca splendens]|uniref:Uncharacterized protein n=1 Tax=Ameca splendens TaxID=208324 RepID=A0ABV0XJ27_9TELE
MPENMIFKAQIGGAEVLVQKNCTCNKWARCMRFSKIACSVDNRCKRLPNLNAKTACAAGWLLLPLQILSAVLEACRGCCCITMNGPVADVFLLLCSAPTFLDCYSLLTRWIQCGKDYILLHLQL